VLQIRWKLDGDAVLSRVLGTENKKLRSFYKPLSESANLLLKEIKINFETEGGLVGGWTPLKQSTIQGRLREGFGAGPILQKTKRYKNSFAGVVNSKIAVVSSFGVDYHKYHQSLQPRSRLPRRQTLFLREEAKREMVRFFQSYLRFEV
jgi:phage gpG-like protein